MSITIFDDTYISKRLSDYQKTRNQRDVHSSEEHKNSYEIGLDNGFYDGYLQCLKDLGIRQDEQLFRYFN